MIIKKFNKKKILYKKMIIKKVFIKKSIIKKCRIKKSFIKKSYKKKYYKKQCYKKITDPAKQHAYRIIRSILLLRHSIYVLYCTQCTCTLFFGI